ncbi:hypothetical protein M0R45_003309 [Rubus argutus]|uniref:Proteasome endopeptidase complex n=1 Tax=Rubus argutus TaxID=59490 RepID=A0AAW1YHH9_RUBAR
MAEAQCEDEATTRVEAGMALDHDSTQLELTGTTVIASFYKGGIIVGYDSRGSNEGQRLHPLQIMDTADKFCTINASTLAIKIGNRVACKKMCNYVIRESSCMVENDESTENAPSASVFYTLEKVEKYLEKFLEEGKSFGALIIGLDAEGPHIHSIYLGNQGIVKQTDCMFVSVGSGSTRAKETFDEKMGTEDVSQYSYNLSKAEATDLVLRALFNATFHSKFTGGTLHVKHVHETWENIRDCDVLEAYEQYYESYEEDKILFLVFNSCRGYQAVYSDDLINLFRPYAEPSIAHRVAHIRIKKGIGLYFHRLVFRTHEDAARVYSYVEQAGPHGITTPALLTEFPNRVYLDTEEPNVPLYVNWASKRLLQVLRDSCIEFR